MNADFFIFLRTVVQSFFSPFVGLLMDSNITNWLGAPLLIILCGFWLIRIVYNMFISHRDSMGTSQYSALARSSGSSIESTSTTYSSAYRERN